MLPDDALAKLREAKVGPMLDPKPRKRIRLSGSAYRQLHTQVVHGKNCLICDQWARSMHHLVPRSHGGDDVPENLVPLCGDGTKGCHADVEERRGDARGKIRARLLGCQVAYVTERAGAGYLDRHYPELVAEPDLRELR